MSTYRPLIIFTTCIFALMLTLGCQQTPNTQTANNQTPINTNKNTNADSNTIGNVKGDFKQSAYPNIKYQVEASQLTLNLRDCEYGRGSATLNSLQHNITQQMTTYLSQSAKRELVLNRTEQSSASILAAINFDQIAKQLIQKQRTLTFTPAQLIGADTCQVGQLILTSELTYEQTAHTFDPTNWQKHPNMQFIHATGFNTGTDTKAIKHAQQNALKKVLQDNLIALSAEQTQFGDLLTALPESYLAKLTSRVTHFETLNIIQSQGTQVDLLVTLDHVQFSQQINRLIDSLSLASVAIKTDSPALNKEITQLLSTHHIKLNPNPNNADVILIASANMINLGTQYQADIQISIKARTKSTASEQLMQWQNTPSLISVSRQDDTMLNQLIKAHLSISESQNQLIQWVQQAKLAVTIDKLN